MSNIDDFMPHGQCFLWKPELVWLHTISDSLIALSYYSIPLALGYFVYKRRDLPFNWMFLMFGAFILACGTTHVMGIWTIWNADYWLDGAVKVATAGVSLVSAGLLWPLIPKALAIPSPAQLEEANRELKKEITERKRTEEAIERLRRRNELILASAGEGIYGLDAHGRATFVNPAAATMLGWTTDELIGRPMHSILHHSKPDGSPYPAEECPIYAAFRDSKVHRSDTEVFWRKDGTGFPVEYMSTPIHEGSSLVGAVVTFRDITDRKRAEEALRKSEANYRTLVESARDVIYTLAPDGTITSLNLVFETITGWSRAEWIGRPFGPLVHPDDLPLALETFTQCLAGRTPATFELRICAQTGGYRIGEFTETPQITNGKAVSILGVARDITERKRAEEALHESEDRFRSAFENTAVGMVLLDTTGRFLHANRAFCALVGYSKDELLPKTFLEITHPEDLEKNLPVVKRLMAGEIESFFVEKRYLHKQGHPIWVHASVASVRDASGKPCNYIAQSQDITERKRAEEALCESERRLRQLLSDRERISRDLHDNIIQTLYAIGLGLEECQRLSDEESKDAAKKLGRVIDDLNAVIKDVRSYIAWSEPKVSGGQQLKMAIERLARTMGDAHRLYFRLKLDEEAAERLTPEEANHVLHIVREAMSNSLRHSEAKKGVVSLQMQDGCIRLQVEDDGIGFDDHVTKLRGQGLRNIAARAEKLGAHMEIIAEPGKGVRIILDIPKESTHASSR